MSRLIAVFKLALLPFQFSWAAVASYCMHERTSAQAQHVGHHEHKHETADLPNKAEQGLQAADTFDVDCCLCHGLGIGATHFSPIKVTSAMHGNVVVQVAAPFSGVAPTPPERPQWHSLA